MPKALFSLSGVPRRLNRRGIADMLVLVPPEPGASLYDGISSLEAGQLLTADRAGGQARRFWCARARERAAAAGRPGVRGGIHRAVRPGGGRPGCAASARSACCSAASLDSTSVAEAAALCSVARRTPDRLHRRSDDRRLSTASLTCPAGRSTRRRWRARSPPGTGNVDHLPSCAPRGCSWTTSTGSSTWPRRPTPGPPASVWYEGIAAAAQRRDISVLLTGKERELRSRAGPARPDPVPGRQAADRSRPGARPAAQAPTGAVRRLPGSSRAAGWSPGCPGTFSSRSPAATTTIRCSAARTGGRRCHRSIPSSPGSSGWPSAAAPGTATDGCCAGSTPPPPGSAT